MLIRHIFVSASLSTHTFLSVWINTIIIKKKKIELLIFSVTEELFLTQTDIHSLISILLLLLLLSKNFFRDHSNISFNSNTKFKIQNARYPFFLFSILFTSSPLPLASTNIPLCISPLSQSECITAYSVSQCK